ncbi:MAG: zinc ribbon domain-containing protein [Actinobacteria bacterium]|nr:MAG: zinc ribbon domain-containing protein [Actinomycetota bacterium]
MTAETAGFCTTCGTPLTVGNAFCTTCGSPAPAPQAAAPPAPPQPVAPTPSTPAPPASTEQVVSVLGGLSIGSGFMGLKRTSYTLVVTQTRLIFAELTAEMLKTAIEQARSDTKAQGGGFFKQWGAQISASFAFAERYWQLPPDAALAETPGNFMIDRRTIEKMKLHTGMAREDAPDDPDYITLKAGGTKYKILLSGSFAHAKEALIRAGLI